PPALSIHPPLINSSNPWATSLDDLRLLYACPSTGAVTTRTSLIKGFAHDAAKHQYVGGGAVAGKNASINSLGYSPHTLETYLGFIKTISAEQQTVAPSSKKVFIVSVTGTPSEVAQCYTMIAAVANEVVFPLAMEVNLSCPNIEGKPPPAYGKGELVRYLEALQGVIDARSDGDDGKPLLLPRIPFGLKAPPYTHSTEYDILIGALAEHATSLGERGEKRVSPVSFITSTNTLGSCLLFAGGGDIDHDGGGGMDGVLTSFALPGFGIGGMAGAPLHPLALGNVATLRRRILLEENREPLGHIQIIGIGGVSDADGYRRMRTVGAEVVGVGTGLLQKGLEVFGEIENGVGGR
ncbi:hypothetical protein B0T17DRAFT_470087, partial [Bombardia bombarda]